MPLEKGYCFQDEYAGEDLFPKLAMYETVAENCCKYFLALYNHLLDFGLLIRRGGSK